MQGNAKVLETLADLLASELSAASTYFVHSKMRDNWGYPDLAKRAYDDSMDEMRATLRDRPGFMRAHWCGRQECEESVKNETGATIRCIPLDAEEEQGRCVYCGEPSTQRVLFGRAY